MQFFFLFLHSDGFFFQSPENCIRFCIENSSNDLENISIFIKKHYTFLNIVWFIKPKLKKSKILFFEQQEIIYMKYTYVLIGTYFMNWVGKFTIQMNNNLKKIIRFGSFAYILSHRSIHWMSLNANDTMSNFIWKEKIKLGYSFLFQ